MRTPRRPPADIAEEVEHKRRYRKHIARTRLTRSLGYAMVGAIIAFSIIFIVSSIW